MLPLVLVVLAALPANPLTLVVSVDGGMHVELLDDARFLSLERRWTNFKDTDAADWVLELDVYGLADKKAQTLAVPMRGLHEGAEKLFVDATNLHPTRGKAVAPFQLEFVDYRAASGEASFLVENHRSQKDGSWKRRWIWAVLNAADGKIVRAHILHDEAGAEKADLFSYHFDLLSIEAGGGAAWFSGVAQKKEGDRVANTVTLSRVDLTTGATTWTQQLDLPASTNKNRAGFRFAANDDFSALVLAEYSEASYEPIDPKPVAYVVRPKTGQVQQVPIPYTPYGLALDAAGETLAVGSNQGRKMITFRVSDGKVLKEVPTGEHLHRFVLLPGGKQLLVVFGGPNLEVRGFPGLEKVSTISAKSMGLKGFCGDGSRISADGRTLALPRCDARGLSTSDGAVVLRVK